MLMGRSATLKSNVVGSFVSFAPPPAINSFSTIIPSVLFPSNASLLTWSSAEQLIVTPLSHFSHLRLCKKVPCLFRPWLLRKWHMKPWFWKLNEFLHYEHCQSWMCTCFLTACGKVKQDCQPRASRSLLVPFCYYQCEETQHTESFVNLEYWRSFRLVPSTIVRLIFKFGVSCRASLSYRPSNKFIESFSSSFTPVRSKQSWMNLECHNEYLDLPPLPAPNRNICSLHGNSLQTPFHHIFRSV